MLLETLPERKRRAVNAARAYCEKHNKNNPLLRARIRH